MQAKRQAILDYLKENGHAAVDELAEALGGLTTVTVRHHLDILRSEGLVSDPIVRHREARGRPQHVFALTEKASRHFPKGYDDLAAKMLAEVQTHSPQLINVIFEGMAARISAEAPQPVAGESVKKRLDRAVNFLNERGYVARWENAPEGYLIHTCNCPYEALAGSHPELCNMDMVLIGNLMGSVPQRVSRVADGATSCAYLFAEK